MEQIKTAVGERIRSLREQRNMSLSELARVSNIAKATLSKLEAGDANPTLDTLWHLSNALRVPLSGFFGEERKDVAVVRRDDMRRVDGDVIKGVIAASADIEAARVEFLYGRFQAGKVQSSPAHQPGVVEHTIIESGSLRICANGADVVLEPGDYMRMEADTPHSYEALDGDVRAFLLMEYPHSALG